MILDSWTLTASNLIYVVFWPDFRTNTKLTSGWNDASRGCHCHKNSIWTVFAIHLTFTKYSYLKFKRSSLTYHTKNSGGKRWVEIEKCFLWLQPSHLWLFGRVRDALHSTVSWQTLLCVQLPLICGNARADLPPKICAERPQRSELGHTHTRKKKTWKRPWACRPYHADLENRDDKSLL